MTTEQNRRSDTLPHDPDNYGTCHLCEETWPCQERKRQRAEHREIIAYLASDLYGRVPLLDHDGVGNRMTSPLGWSVWWTYGEIGIPMTIRDPRGKPYASTTNGSAQWLDEFLP